MADGSVGVGAELAVEWIVMSAHPVLRVLPTHETLMRVVGGAVRIVSGAGIELLELGDEARIPAGGAHRVTAAGDGDARLLVQRRRVR